MQNSCITVFIYHRDADNIVQRYLLEETLSECPVFDITYYIPVIFSYCYYNLLILVLYIVQMVCINM